MIQGTGAHLVPRLPLRSCSPVFNTTRRTRSGSSPHLVVVDKDARAACPRYPCWVPWGRRGRLVRYRSERLWRLSASEKVEPIKKGLGQQTMAKRRGTHRVPEPPPRGYSPLLAAPAVAR